MIETDATGWKCFRSSCSCSFSIVTGELLGCCIEHEPFATTAVNAFDIWLRMQMYVIREAAEREAA